MRPLVTHMDTACNRFISNLRRTRNQGDSISVKPKLNGRKTATPRTLTTEDSDTSEPLNPCHNYILAALREEEYARVAPHLEWVELPRGEVLYRFGEQLKYAYFPTTATVSLLCAMDDGTSVEVAVVGHEGILGISTFLGGSGALTQATVLNPGYGYRINAKVLKQEASDYSGSFQPLLMRYIQTLIAQMAQTTGCIRRHTVEQQLCRWLLLNFDRVPSGNLEMTQELIANMLGVRRESITEVAGKLQVAGLISYSRGHIEVLDRPGLETQACECYKVVKKELCRLYSELVPSGHVTSTHIHVPASRIASA